VSDNAYAGDVAPQQAWDGLSRDPKALLVDVRTRPEWLFVGIADLGALGRKPLFVEWQVFPSMQVDGAFADKIRAAGATPDTPLYFICRSGGRSKAAAIAMTGQGFKHCYNVSGGFEGPPDAQRHRGHVDGWKAAALPWVQE
jgi:rhodanese-related sulfurtransferase